MTQSRCTEDGRTMITDQRQTGTGWVLSGAVPTWVREPRESDFRLNADVLLQLESVRYLEHIQYSAVMGRQSSEVIGSEVQSTGKRLEVLISRGSKVEYAKGSKTMLLHIADVVVDERKAQLSFEHCGDGGIHPRLQYYSASTLVVREERGARY